MTAYATPSDLAEWLGTPAPANPSRLLRSASFRVAAACELNPYGGTPVGSGDALRDATCAQAAVWVQLGVSPDAVGVGTGVVQRTKILDALIVNDTSVAAATLDEAINTLAPEALAILTAAGLLGGFEIADGGFCVAEATERPTVGWPGACLPAPSAQWSPAADADPATTTLTVRYVTGDTQVAMGEFVIVQSSGRASLTILPEPVGSYCRVKLDASFPGGADCHAQPPGLIDGLASYPLDTPGQAVGLESVMNSNFAIF